MQEQWAQLGRLLDQVNELYTAILELGRKKREILVQGKTAELENITRDEEFLVRQVGKLEMERSELLRRLTRFYKLPQDISLQQLYGQAEPEAGQRLAKQGAKLTSLLNELKTVNGHNMQLIQQAMQFIDYNVNLLTRAVSDSNYGPPVGGGKPQTANRSWIDAKA